MVAGPVVGVGASHPSGRRDGAGGAGGGGAAAGRPRVLIEAMEWAVGTATADAFRRDGWDVDTCSGPVGTDRRCPYIDGGDCPKVTWADVVVSRLGLQDVRNRELVGLLARRGERPVVIETPAPTYTRFRRELAGCRVVPYPARLSELVAAARTALDAARAVSS